MRTRDLILVIVLLACLILQMGVGLCASPPWEQLGPSGSDQFLVKLSPFDSQTLYSLSHHSVHISTNGAASWQAIHDHTMNRRSFLSIGFPDHDGEHLVVSSTGGGVFETVNSGQDWSMLIAGLPSIDNGRVTLSSMITLPDGKLIAGVSAVRSPAWVYSLERGATNWQPQGIGMDILLPEEELNNIPTVFVSVDAETNLWASLYGGGVYRKGTNEWEPRNGNLPAETLRATFLAHDATQSGVLVLGTEDDWIYRSQDSGQTWMRLPLPADLQDLENSSHPLPLVYTVAVDPANPDVIIVRTTDYLFSQEIVLLNARQDQGEGNGTYTTLDGGMTWYSRPTFPLRIAFNSSQTVSTGNPPFAGVTRSKNLYLSSVGPAALYKSDDGGISVSESDTGIYSYFCNALAFMPEISSNLFVGGEEGISSCSLTGTEWTHTDAVEDYMYVWSFAPDYQNTGTFFYATGQPAWDTPEQMGLYRMSLTDLSDTNRNPSEDQILSGTGVWRIVTSPAHPNIIYVATQEAGILFSSDNGLTWSGFNDGLMLPKSITDIELSENGQPKYASFRSSSGNLLAEPSEVWWLPPEEAGGVYRVNSDTGQWETMPGVTGAVMDIEQTIINGQTNLLAAVAQGIYVCTNGLTWEKSLSLSWLSVYDIAIHPNKPDYLYAATSAGVLRSTDGGKQWHDYSDGLTLRNVQTLTFDEEAETLYAGTLGNSVFQLVPDPNPVPVIQLETEALHFCPVSLGYDTALSLSITNAGEADLVLSDIISTNDSFFISNVPELPVTLTPGGWIRFSVVFQPAYDGEHTGNLVFTGNANNSPLSLPMIGSGYTETGTIDIDVFPGSAAWSFETPWGDISNVTGDPIAQTVPTGIYTIVWTELPDYHLPTNQPAEVFVRNGESVTVIGEYRKIDPDDVDADGIADWWEIEYFGSWAAADPEATCSNRLNSVREAYIAGLDPHDEQSFFWITNDLHSSPAVIEWSGVSGRVYSVWSTTNLLNGFWPVETNILWTQTTYTNTVETENCRYYRINVEMAP